MQNQVSPATQASPQHLVLNIHPVRYFTTREEARQYCAEIGVPQSVINKNTYYFAPKSKRWFV